MSHGLPQVQVNPHLNIRQTCQYDLDPLAAQPVVVKTVLLPGSTGPTEEMD